MKEMLERICRNKIVFSSLEIIDPKLLKSRKKTDIFSCVDLKKYYHIIFRINQKSRFLIKNVEELFDLEKKLILHVNHNYKFKHAIINAPLCSKAQELLKQSGWKVYQ